MDFPQPQVEILIYLDREELISSDTGWPTMGQLQDFFVDLSCVGSRVPVPVFLLKRLVTFYD